jgi:hypothetical protein
MRLRVAKPFNDPDYTLLHIRPLSDKVLLISLINDFVLIRNNE